MLVQPVPAVSAALGPWPPAHLRPRHCVEWSSTRKDPAGLEEGHENGQRAGTPLLWRQAQGVGAAQPGEEKASG